MERYLYEAIIIPNELGGYDARVPGLGIITQGDDLADAAYMAQDAMSLRISSKLKDGEAVPAVGSFGAQVPQGGTVMGILTFASDTDELLDKFDAGQDISEDFDFENAETFAGF